MDLQSKHYIRINENNEIIRAFSNAFDGTTEDDILYKETNDRHFNLALRHFETGFYKYQFIDGEIVNSTIDHSDELLQIEITKRLTELGQKYFALFAQGFTFEDVTYGCQISDIVYFKGMQLDATLDLYNYEPDGLKDLVKDITGAYVTMLSKDQILRLVAFGTKHVVDLRKAYSDEEIEIKALKVIDL